MRDWVGWHADYDQPGSALARRLAEVRRQLRIVLDERLSRPVDGVGEPAAGPLSLVSVCAGQGRDVIGVLADHPDRQRVRALLVEADPVNAGRAEAAARAAGLTGVRVRRADAGRTDAYAGAVPAAVILACGVFGNISDRDVQATIGYLPSLAAPGAVVLWTRSRRAPDLTPAVRGWFGASGFAEVDFVAPAGDLYSVGVHRLVAPPARFRPGVRLFRFDR